MLWANTGEKSDVFHIVKQCEELANVLARMAQGATTRNQSAASGRFLSCI